MDDLPEDIFHDIFLRLPVKSLLGSKMVCKSWRSHISNPEFLKRHVQRTTNNPNDDLFILHRIYYDNANTNQLSVINVNFLDRAISLNLPIIDYNFYCVVASCNGLLCLAYFGNEYQGWPQKLFLWNPVTRQVKDINMYTIKVKVLTHTVVFGFGFDRATGDYKAVRIIQMIVTPFVNRVEVYSLNENCWKEIKVDLEIGHIESFNEVPTVNGSIYWLTRKTPRDYGLAMLSFNVQTLNFSTIQLPDSLSTLWPSEYWTSCDHVDIFEFKESVALINSSYDQEGIEIYTLDEGGCWIKKLTIECLNSVIGCLKTGEFMGWKPCDKGTGREMVLYDSVNEVVKIIRPKSDSFRTYNYTESLVNLN